MKYSQLLPFIAILISLAVSAQQPNSKFQSSKHCKNVLVGQFFFVCTELYLFVGIIKHSSHCRQRVTSDANLVLRYVTKVLESNEVIENKTIELKPGKEA